MFAQELPPQSEWDDVALPAVAQAVAEQTLPAVIDWARQGHNGEARRLADLLAERSLEIETKLGPAERDEPAADVESILHRRGGVRITPTGGPAWGGVVGVELPSGDLHQTDARDKPGVSWREPL